VSATYSRADGLVAAMVEQVLGGRGEKIGGDIGGGNRVDQQGQAG